MDKFFNILNKNSKVIASFAAGFILSKMIAKTPKQTSKDPLDQYVRYQLVERLFDNINKGRTKNIEEDGRVLNNVFGISVSGGKIITDSLVKGEVLDIFGKYKVGENMYYGYYKNGETYYVLSEGISNRVIGGFGRDREEYKIMIWESQN